MRLAFEPLESRRMFAFGLTTTTNSYTVDTGAGLVFSVQRTHPQGSVGDLTSVKLNGTELEAPFATSSRYSHYESGLSSSTVVTATVDPSGQWILITCDDTAGVGVIQYYLGRKGFNNIYMATYSAGPGSPSPGEMRFIDYTNPTLLTNIPAPSNNAGSSGAIESSDVFGHADGTTTSKYYGELRAIDTQTYGVSGTASGTQFGLWMNIGNRETSSGGPFYKDIDFQNNELYTYTFSGHSQTENFRPGLKGFYALLATNTNTPPSAPDYSFIDTLGVGSHISGYTGASGRGTLSGTASGVPSGLQATVALSNAADQYWALPDSVTGAYTISGITPGTYTETLYQGELAVGTVSVTISAGATTRQNITNTNNYLLLSSSSASTSTPVVNSPIFRIGTWDGTPIGFLNADKIQNMHPTDVRMSPWAADSTGLTNFTVGTDPDSSFPMAEWHAQTSAAPFVDTDNRITFTLTAAQAATALTLRVGLTRLDSGRPNLSVNGHSTSVQSIASEPNSRGLTTGNWRGNNAVYVFNLSTSWMHSGTNTIDIFCTSGSTGTLYSGYQIYDAIDLVPTSSITSAPVVTSITVSPSNPTVGTGSQTTFTATARDQLGNVIPANFTWSATSGTVDGTGLYTAPVNSGSDTVKATSGSVNGSTNVTIIGPPTLTAAVSRKIQGGTPYDLTLPLSGTPAVEPRVGGPTSLILTFGQTLDTSAALTLSLTSGTGSASYLGTTQVSISLSGATDGQTLGITLGGVRRSGGSAGSYTINIGVLAGDVDGSESVNVADVIATKVNSGAALNATNFLVDLNGDGSINVADVLTAKLNSGHVLVGGGGQAASAPEMQRLATSSSTSAALIQNDAASPVPVVGFQPAQAFVAVITVAPSISGAAPPPDTALIPAVSAAPACVPAASAVADATDQRRCASVPLAITMTAVGNGSRSADNCRSSNNSQIARERAIRDTLFSLGGYDALLGNIAGQRKKKSPLYL